MLADGCPHVVEDLILLCITGGRVLADGCRHVVENLIHFCV